MNILIKLMSIVSLVIAPSLAQMNFNTTTTPAFGENTTIQLDATTQQGSQQRVIRGSHDSRPPDQVASSPPNQAAYDAYRTLITMLEQDGLFKIEENTISVQDGKILIDGKPLPDDVALKYEYLATLIKKPQ